MIKMLHWKSQLYLTRRGCRWLEEKKNKSLLDGLKIILGKNLAKGNAGISKDWGQHSENLRPNSIVRLEGVSVNEWNDKKSININRSSRVTILSEGNSNVITSINEPLEISELIKNEGFGSTVGRIITIKPDVIVKKDGTGTLDIFRGRISDSSGSVGFLSWVPFNFESGDLVKMENISVRKFRDTPEINISSDAKIELYIDNSFPKIDDLVHTIENLIYQI